MPIPYSDETVGGEEEVDDNDDYDDDKPFSASDYDAMFHLKRPLMKGIAFHNPI